jgi:hypothetical protein
MVRLQQLGRRPGVQEFRSSGVQEFSFWLGRKLQASAFVVTTTTTHTITFLDSCKKLSIFLFEFVQQQLSHGVQSGKNIPAGAGDAFKALESLLPVVQ